MEKSFGKLILAGEHAVVYGKPALIVPIDEFCEVTIRDMGENKGIKIINQEEDNHGLAKYVVEKFIREFQISSRKNIEIEINSHIPVGRGFGSSAAVITALVKGLAEFFSVGVDPLVDTSILLDFCITSENLIHKNSSGADIYAAWFGKSLWFRKEGGNLKLFRELEELRGLGELLGDSYLIDTGKPVESTGEMVQIAAKLKNSRPKFFEKQINLIEKCTLSLLQNLTASPMSKSTDYYVSIHEDITQIEKSLEKIGVVSEEVRQFIKDLRVRQIPAKICGAGGLAKGSGVVIALTKDVKTLGEVCHSYNYSILDVKILT